MINKKYERTHEEATDPDSSIVLLSDKSIHITHTKERERKKPKAYYPGFQLVIV